MSTGLIDDETLDPEETPVPPSNDIRDDPLQRPIGPQSWRPSDLFINLAGGDVKTVRAYGDRGWFVGLGWALIVAATVAAGSLTTATVIFTDMKTLDFNVLAWVFVGYFLVILFLDRWIVSDQKAGFEVKGRKSWWRTVFIWLLNLSAELVKMAPRLGLVVVGSLLFADILMMVIFSSAISEQVKVNQATAVTQYNTTIDTEINKQIQTKTAERDSLQKQIDAANANSSTATKAIADVDARIQALADRNGKFYSCYLNGFGWTYCQTTDYQNLLDERDRLTGDAPSTKAHIDELNTKIQDINDYLNPNPPAKSDGTVPATVYSDVRQKFEAQAPTAKDGLLERKEALSQLTDKSEGSSNYNAGADFFHSLFRWFLLLFELLPVMMKFTRSITQRTAYASSIASREEAARIRCWIEVEEAELERDVRLQRFKTESRIFSEFLATEKEVMLRANARERIKYRLWDYFQRNRKADTPSPDAGKEPFFTEEPPVQEAVLLDHLKHASSSSSARRKTRTRVVDNDNSLYE
ncbi:DUF4407 domain-containing protein [Arthrobacter sp. CC3]|uniref:DUF4407 domain-containing protein n=1 Tax=Arthrobacter sp. CC3 TaxID=3029185 RepID=UPI0032657A49